MADDEKQHLSAVVTTSVPVEITPTDWDAQVAMKKAAWFIGQVAVAFLASPKVTTALHKAGITIDPSVASVLVPSVVGAALHWIHDYYKVKTGANWL